MAWWRFGEGTLEALALRWVAPVGEASASPQTAQELYSELCLFRCSFWTDLNEGKERTRGRWVGTVDRLTTRGCFGRTRLVGAQIACAV